MALLCCGLGACAKTDLPTCISPLLFILKGETERELSFLSVYLVCVLHNVRQMISPLFWRLREKFLLKEMGADGIEFSTSASLDRA
jgi:hypothetical protein